MELALRNDQDNVGSCSNEGGNDANGPQDQYHTVSVRYRVERPFGQRFRHLVVRKDAAMLIPWRPRNLLALPGKPTAGLAMRIISNNIVPPCMVVSRLTGFAEYRPDGYRLADALPCFRNYGTLQ